MSSKEEIARNRKEQVLNAAAELFAEKGYYKTTTADVARLVGVTQPYVFHFFKTKEELYLAVLQRANEKVMHAFSSVDAPSDQLEDKMGKAFTELLTDSRNEILLVMMAFTIPETAIREYVKAEFDSVFERVKDRFADAGLDDPETKASGFIGTGLLISMAEVLDMPKLIPWDDDAEK
ncbi:TetR/AcrR family transcriptional regulator [Bacillus gobiensis]|uniref:TetR/AcrR family transcriptional regulator n=1 Tax=Bacillus gobiensis TaxID=1441095 RepID=UPI003D1BD957